MKYETAKSIMLTVLVLLSFMLTWSIWTYQPKYEEMENTKYIKEISIGNRKVDTSAIIKPVQVFFHKDNKHFGTTDSQEINNIVKDVRKWRISDLENISMDFSKQKFRQFVHQNGHIELVYPDDLTIDILKSIYQINEKNLHGLTFDRIIIDYQNRGKTGIPIYFISYKSHKIYSAKSEGTQFAAIEEAYNKAKAKYPVYFPYEVSEERVIFLPKEQIKLNQYQYYVHLLDPDKFKDALFSDPSFVKKEVLPNQIEYTDGSRLMEVDLNNHILNYVNPQGNEESETVVNDLIQQSIDFVNDHGGWTDSYQFFSWDKFNEQTNFRLYLNGEPVFNQFGMAEIVQYWKNNDIYSYDRPLIKLQLSDRENKPTTLPTGYEAIEKIESMPGYNPEFLEAVVVGYELIIDRTKESVLRDRTVLFQPAWFYCYAGVWQKIDFEPLKNSLKGGHIGGLE